MIIADVNVYVYAARREHGHHELARSWLTATLNGSEPLGVLDETLAATVRLMTHHRILETPSTNLEALAFCTAVRSGRSAVTPALSDRRWRHFERLTSELGLRGSDIPDALLAATALTLDATVATFDRGFRRYPGLRVRILDEER